MFFHDLQCLSGYGDRLLDVWAAATVACLHEPGGVTAIRWSAEGLEYATFVGAYATGLFSVQGCEFVNEAPHGAISMDKCFSHTALNDRGVIPLACGTRQIVLRSGMIWGNSGPDRLHGDLDFYDLDPEIGLDRVVDTYRSVASGTQPDSRVLEGIPADAGKRVGIHIRLGDKLVEEEMAFDMGLPTWRSIELKGNFCIERCIARGEPLFVCSDDLSYKTTLLERIRSRGGDAVAASPAPAYSRLPGYGALVDFFALSRCMRIVQVTKYSTFSIAAAMVGGVPLVNFYRDEGGGVGHRLDIWKSALRELDPG